MGYKRAMVQNLHFEQPDLEGLVVKVSATPIGEFFELSDRVNASEDGRARSDVWRDAFVSHLIEWNLETDDGDPIKPTMDGLMSFDFGFVDSLVAAWIMSLTAAPAPLVDSSNSGPPSAAVSIPMEPL